MKKCAGENGSRTSRSAAGIPTASIATPTSSPAFRGTASWSSPRRTSIPRSRSWSPTGPTGRASSRQRPPACPPNSPRPGSPGPSRRPGRRTASGVRSASASGSRNVVAARRRSCGYAATAQTLKRSPVHSGFPSYSADGKQIVYRVWGEDTAGLRILDIDDRATRVLTTEYDNLPGWSPDGGRILFTRKVDAVNFVIYTIRPDGTDLLRLTTNRANDGHAVWTADGRILWNSGIYGFRDEAALYDNTFQPYGQIFIMNADGTDKRILTDSLWEDSMPLYIPAKV